jgi:hypothetical protein
MRERAWRAIRIEHTEYSGSKVTNEMAPFWQKLARTLMIYGCDNPERYVNILYHYGVPGQKTLATGPFPNMLASDDAWDTYIKHNIQADMALIQQLESAKLTFKCAMTEVSADYPGHDNKWLWHLILMNRMYDLPPLFGCCLAAVENMPDTVAALRGAALDQLMTDPIGYVGTWRANIPVTLKAEAEQLLQLKL